jgi:hypothetical protein
MQKILGFKGTMRTEKIEKKDVSRDQNIMSVRLSCGPVG